MPLDSIPMNKTFLTFALLMFSIAMAAQQTEKAFNIISPEIHPDNSVTFRLYAPNADTVKVSGDWLQNQEAGSVLMTREENGLWTYTTTPLASELYSYFFHVDGMRANDPNNVHRIRDVASVADVFIIGGGQGDLYKVNDVPHGSVTRRWYDSPRNGPDRRMTIYTPPGYEESGKDYPVLYLLHGMGGDEEAWITLGRTALIMDNLIEQGQVTPMIIVMPNGNVAYEAAPGESSMGFYKPSMQAPHTMDGKMEETFPNVMNFVEKNYRIRKGKENRAIAGLSMGGFHSLHISRYYPGTFDYIGLFSPAIIPINASSGIYLNIDETLKEQAERGYKLYWIAIGKSDFLYEQVRVFRDKLDSLKIDYDYRESDGGHTWTNWRVYLAEFVSMLFKEDSKHKRK